MNGKSRLILAASKLALVGAGRLAVSAQENYAAQWPGGIPFSDFKGYEDWRLISASKTDDRIKVFLGNPTIIAAFKAGAPGNGKPSPQGSKITKFNGSC